MPTYDYRCSKCDTVFESFEKIDGPRSKVCPNCGGTAKRMIGAGAGIIFRGSGFYQTDYRSEEYRKRSKEEQAKPSSSEPKKPDKASGAAEPGSKKKA